MQATRGPARRSSAGPASDNGRYDNPGPARSGASPTARTTPDSLTVSSPCGSSPPAKRSRPSPAAGPICSPEGENGRRNACSCTTCRAIGRRSGRRAPGLRMRASRSGPPGLRSPGPGRGSRRAMPEQQRRAEPEQQPRRIDIPADEPRDHPRPDQPLQHLPPRARTATDRCAWYSAGVEYLLDTLAIMVVAFLGALCIPAWDRYCGWLDRRPDR